MDILTHMTRHKNEESEVSVKSEDSRVIVAEYSTVASSALEAENICLRHLITDPMSRDNLDEAHGQMLRAEVHQVSDTVYSLVFYFLKSDA